MIVTWGAIGRTPFTDHHDKLLTKGRHCVSPALEKYVWNENLDVRVGAFIKRHEDKVDSPTGLRCVSSVPRLSSRTLILSNQIPPATLPKPSCSPPHGLPASSPHTPGRNLTPYLRQIRSPVTPAVPNIHNIS